MKQFLSYEDVLKFIYSQLPMYQRQGPKALKYDLSNIESFLDRIGNPHRKFKSIHVAGTNGKGSTAHLIAAAFQNSGKRTGLYTSPHYKDYRERIKLDGEMIKKLFVTQFINQHFNIIQDIKPSYFELSVAMAFEYFSKEQVDIAIIEVGLGGRLDSTNVLNPLLSVITNISMDHMQTLGNTLGEIAKEKAGIIKNNTPVLIGEIQNETQEVFQQIAKTHDAPLFFADELMAQFKLDSFFCDISEPFLIKNIKYAWASLKVFKAYYPDLGPDEESLPYAFKNVKQISNYIGRWEKLGEKPLIIADGAHNEAGWSQMLDYLDKQDFKRLHIVLGFVFDKELEPIFKMLPKNAIYYFCQADIPRAFPAQQLKKEASSFTLEGEAYSTVKEALENAKKIAGPDDLILVVGSIFLVGEVL